MKRLVVALVSVLCLVPVISPGPSAAVSSQAGGPADPNVSWLALGDSYASGEGNWTVPASDDCQRADGKDGRGRAWSVVAQQDLAARPEMAARGLQFPVDQFQLMACTSATSEKWRDQFVDSKRPPADLVTFSFGGNNVGFGEVITRCAGIGVLDASSPSPVVWDLQGRSCTAGEPFLSNAINTWATNRDSTEFGLSLPRLLEDVATTATNPGGKIVVTGYPQIFEESSRWGFWNGNHCARVRAADADTIRGLIALMNQRLKEGVEAASGKTNGVETVYVDAASVYESPAGRHGLCTGEPWLNGLSFWSYQDSVLPRPQRSFHPNQAGHEALGKAVADRIAQLDFSTIIDPASCTPGALKPAAVAYATSKGLSGAVTEVRDPRCESGWARGCVLNSITGDTHCTRFFQLRDRWTQLDLDWDACPRDLISAGASDQVALRLAADCPDAEELTDEPAAPPTPIGGSCQEALAAADELWMARFAVDAINSRNYNSVQPCLGTPSALEQLRGAEGDGPWTQPAKCIDGAAFNLYECWASNAAGVTISISIYADAAGAQIQGVEFIGGA